MWFRHLNWRLGQSLLYREFRVPLLWFSPFQDSRPPTSSASLIALGSRLWFLLPERQRVFYCISPISCCTVAGQCGEHFLKNGKSSNASCFAHILNPLQSLCAWVQLLQPVGSWILGGFLFVLVSLFFVCLFFLVLYFCMFSSMYRYYLWVYQSCLTLL